MNFKTQTMVFIGENNVSVDAVPIDQVVVNRDIGLREVDRSIQFKLYNVPNPACSDVIFATYSNPYNKPAYQVKTELLPFINIPQNKMVVMGDCCVLTDRYYNLIQRMNPTFSSYYRDESDFIPVFRFTPEEVEVNRMRFRYEFEVIPYGRVVSFDYDGWDERFYGEEDYEDEDYEDEEENVIQWGGGVSGEELNNEEQEEGEVEEVFTEENEEEEVVNFEEGEEDCWEEETNEERLRQHFENLRIIENEIDFNLSQLSDVEMQDDFYEWNE